MRFNALIEANLAHAKQFVVRIMKLGKRDATTKTLKVTGETFGFGLNLSQDGAGALRNFSETAGYQLGQFHLLGKAHERGALPAVVELRIPKTGSDHMGRT